MTPNNRPFETLSSMSVAATPLRGVALSENIIPPPPSKSHARRANLAKQEGRALSACRKEARLQPRYPLVQLCVALAAPSCGGGVEELFSGPMLVIVPVVGMAVILAFVAICFGGFHRGGSAPDDSISR